MKFQYVFEHALFGYGEKDPHFELAGIWLFDQANLDLDFLYLPGYDDLEQRGQDIVNGYIENDEPFPADMLERIQARMPSYMGAISDIQETDEYQFAGLATPALLKAEAAKHGRYYPWFFDKPKAKRNLIIENLPTNP